MDCVVIYWKASRLSKNTAIIYYGGFIRFGGVFSHVRAIEQELHNTGWNVVAITLDSLPIWCRYVPHLVEKLVNFFNRPLGFLYKGRVTRLLYKLFFDKKADVRIFEDIYIAWDSEIPSITILHAVWSDNLQSNPVSTKQQNKLKMHEALIVESLNHPVATDQSSFKKNISGNKKSIVYVGALEARKNVLFLLKVFKKLSETDPDYKLTIVGDGPDRNELADFAKVNRLNTNFLGSLSHEDVVSELHRHGIYLHTSIKESFSYSLLEAKLAGLITCASGKLQVPGEFIDVAISTFNVDDWCNGILNIDWTPAELNADNYTVEKMTLSTLRLAR